MPLGSPPAWSISGRANDLRDERLVLEPVLRILWWEIQQAADQLAAGPEVAICPIICVHEPPLLRGDRVEGSWSWRRRSHCGGAEWATLPSWSTRGPFARANGAGFSQRRAWKSAG
jgi:hypothetical protein